jgi:hypothetical protein
MRQIDFTDGYTTSEAPVQTPINFSELSSYATDNAFQTAITNAGLSLSDGMMYYNTTDSRVHYYDGSAWKVLAIKTGDTLVNTTLTTPTISTINNTGTLTLPTSTDTLVGRNTTDTLTNKTLTSPTITGTGTATFADETVTGALRVGSSGSADSKSVLDLVSTTKGFLPPRMTTIERDAISSPTTGLVIYNTSTNKMNVYNGSSWVEVGSSGAGGINYIQQNNGNPDAENDTAGWSLYDDAAASPVDGSGGTVAATWTRTTSNPLRGLASFLYTPDTSGQGEGVAFDFDIDPADKGKMLVISLDYILSAAIAEGDYTVWIYDVTNSRLIQPAPYKLSGIGGMPYSFKSQFQASIDSTSYRLMIHQAVANPGSAAVTLKVDNVSVGPQGVAFASPITDWQSFTMNIGATTTPPTKGTTAVDNAKWRRVGDSMEILYQFSSTSGGATGSGTYLFPLPSGYSIDTAKLVAPSSTIADMRAHVGSGWFTSGSNRFSLSVQAYSSTQLFCSVLSNAGVNASEFSSGFGGGVFSSGDPGFSFIARVPIVGWSSSTAISQSDSSEGRVVFARYSGTTQSLTANTQVNFDTKEADTFGSVTTGGSWKFTAPVSGYYTVNFSIYTTTSVSNFIHLWKNGSDQGYINYDGASRNGFYGTRTIQLNAGDYIDIRPEATDGTLGGATSVNFIEISKQSGSQSIQPVESIQARYTTNAGQSFTSATEATVIFETRDIDSTMSYNTGNGKYVVPVSGTYEFGCSLLWSSSSAGVRQLLFYKGLSTLFVVFQQAMSSNETRVNDKIYVKCLAGDELYVNGYQTSGGNLTLFANTSYNQIYIKRIGNY